MPVMHGRSYTIEKDAAAIAQRMVFDKGVAHDGEDRTSAKVGAAAVSVRLVAGDDEADGLDRGVGTVDLKVGAAAFVVRKVASDLRGLYIQECPLNDVKSAALAVGDVVREFTAEDAQTGGAVSLESASAFTRCVPVNEVAHDLDDA